MLNHLQATNLRLEIDIKIGNDFAIPDAGTLALTIRDDAGVPLAGFDAKPLPDTALNFVAVEVPAASNTLAAGKDLGLRYAELRFKTAGKSGMVKTTYRLIRFMPVSSGAEEVRQALGISYEELPDSDIDVFQSYLPRVSNAKFLAALTSGTVATLYANRILVYSEALRIAPSLRARILKQEEKDNALYTRFLMDFDALLAQLQGALDEAENALDTINDEVILSGRISFLVSTPTDRVTG